MFDFAAADMFDFTSKDNTAFGSTGLCAFESADMSDFESTDVIAFESTDVFAFAIDFAVDFTFVDDFDIMLASVFAFEFADAVAIRLPTCTLR